MMGSLQSSVFAAAFRRATLYYFSFSIFKPPRRLYERGIQGVEAAESHTRRIRPGFEYQLYAPAAPHGESMRM